jgi:hypothetical protein
MKHYSYFIIYLLLNRLATSVAKPYLKTSVAKPSLIASKAKRCGTPLWGPVLFGGHLGR